MFSFIIGFIIGGIVGIILISFILINKEKYYDNKK